MAMLFDYQLNIVVLFDIYLHVIICFSYYHSIVVVVVIVFVEYLAVVAVADSVHLRFVVSLYHDSHVLFDFDFAVCVFVVAVFYIDWHNVALNRDTNEQESIPSIDLVVSYPDRSNESVIVVVVVFAVSKQQTWTIELDRNLCHLVL
jgi:hypothetical protein